MLAKLKEICTKWLIQGYVYNFVWILSWWGDRGSAAVKVLYCRSESRWFDPSWCQWIFHWHKILLIALWPWGRLSLSQKWVPGVFPVGKIGRCVRLTTLPPSCAVVTKSGNLNFLDPSGPVQACNRTDVPFYLADELYLFLLVAYWHVFIFFSPNTTTY